MVDTPVKTRSSLRSLLGAAMLAAIGGGWGAGTRPSRRNAFNPQSPRRAKGRSKDEPHQGVRECERRRRQMGVDDFAEWI